MNTRIGRSGGIRTHGIHIPNVARYQLRYTPIFSSSVFLQPRATRFRLPCVALLRPWRGLASLAWLPSTSASLFPPLAALGCVHQLRYTPIFPSSVFYSRARRFQAAPACGPRRRFSSGAAAVRTWRTRLCMYCLL